MERTRERILGAARVAFLAAPYEVVTLAAVAREAGVSTQTVLNHFTSKEGLLMSVIDAFAAQVGDLRGTPSPGDVGAAVSSLMSQYEVLGDANVSYVAVAARSPAIAREVEVARGDHRRWLEAMFADELAAAQDPSRVLAALYAATDVGTWKLLRRDLGHSVSETAAVLETLVRGALGSIGER